MLLLAPLRADLVLTSGNSQISMDPASAKGVYSWLVDSASIVYQQWFWIRTNAETAESALGTGAVPLVAAQATGNRGAVAYQGDGYTATVRFSLSGGALGSQASDLSELITIKNTSSQVLSLDFFQYANFQFSAFDTVHFLADNRVLQTSQPLSNGGVYLNETITTTDGLVHHQAGVYTDILDSLNDAGVTTLTDSDLAAGDVAWAFQWHKDLAPGGVFLISKDLNVSDPLPVPEPVPWGVPAGLGIAYLVFRRYLHRSGALRG
jgi:hypothetical protein